MRFILYLWPLLVSTCLMSMENEREIFPHGSVFCGSTPSSGRSTSSSNYADNFPKATVRHISAPIQIPKNASSTCGQASVESHLRQSSPQSSNSLSLTQKASTIIAISQSTSYSSGQTSLGSPVSQSSLLSSGPSSPVQHAVVSPENIEQLRAILEKIQSDLAAKSPTTRRKSINCLVAQVLNDNNK